MSQPQPSVDSVPSQNISGENYGKAFKKSFIRCLYFATEAHKNQKRKDVAKTPYINHPIGVAYIISHEAEIPNSDLLRVCLLHDTVEDTEEIEIEDIRTGFGDYIANLVAEVTDDKTLPKQKRKELQITQARTSSPQAKMVKLADKLYNLRDLANSLPEGWTEERRSEYFKWAFEVCKGLKGTNSKLEEKLDTLFSDKGLIANGDPSDGTNDIPSWTKHEELKPLIAAADFAAKNHSSHVTFNGTPYINHLVMVAHILSEEADIQDNVVLCAALLCDAIGKAEVSKEDVVDKFGVEVGNLVAELAYDHSKPLQDQIDYQMSRVGTMSHAAKVITLATIISNCHFLKIEDLGFEHKYLDLAAKFIWSLAGTHPVLEQRLRLILTNRGMVVRPPFRLGYRTTPQKIKVETSLVFKSTFVGSSSTGDISGDENAP